MCNRNPRTENCTCVLSLVRSSVRGNILKCHKNKKYTYVPEKGMEALKMNPLITHPLSSDSTDTPMMEHLNYSAHQL